ncbi:hypothetical protein ANTPLA_LOCUS5217 [Anthophora plagiata]
MFKRKKIQKENHMTYFFGGTAVGMAAGLLAGKLISNTPTGKVKNLSPVKSEIIINKNVNKYSQDDNIRNQYLHNNVNHCHTRSKSTSSCKSENGTEYLLSAIPLNKCDNDLKNNINNFDLEYKYDRSMQKVLYDKSYCTLHNISMEDNARYNLSNRMISENCNEKKKIDYQLFETANIKKELLCTASSKINVNMEDENLLETIKIESTNSFNEKNILKHVKSQENVKLAETFNTLSINFCENSTTYKSLPSAKNSTINPNILPSYIDDASNKATCNDDTYFDNDEENIFNFSSINDFYGSNIISSTKIE